MRIYRGSFRGLRMGTVAALAALLACSGCGRKAEAPPPAPMQVTVARPVQQTVTDYADFTGNTEAVESVEIRARVEGYLESIRFTPGGRVKKGDLLFVIDPRPYQAKLDEAKAEMARQQAGFKLTEATMKKKEAAYKLNAVSEIETIQARAENEVSRAAIQAAAAAVQTAELNLSYTRIHSPINGRISRNMVDVGNLVGASERTLLATIVNDDPVYAYFNVNERDLLYYQERSNGGESPTDGDGKTRVFLGLAGQEGFPFQGRIDYADNRVDRSTGTIQVRGVFPNAERKLWPGLFARIRVPTGTRPNALLVPDSAIGSDQRGEHLMLVNAQNIVELCPVKIGHLIGELRVIESGIGPEQRFIISGLQRARPGLPVEPTEGSINPPAPGSSLEGPK